VGPRVSPLEGNVNKLLQEVNEAKQKVATAGQILFRLGMVDYLGHTSARSETGIVIKPKHSPTIRGMNKLSADDMVVVDADGQLIHGSDRPPSEVHIHTEIYKARPDVNAVVHTHQHAATILGIIEQPIHPLLHIPSSYVDADDVQLWPCASLVTDPGLGAELAASLGQSTFCHLQGHGIVAVGATVEDAVVNAVMLEELSHANMAVLATGKEPRLISKDELAGLRKHRGPVRGRWEYFKQLLEG
jgi:L-ribulose-5-phosphate 4-epimerase